MSVKLLTEHHLEFLSLIGGCRGLSESTLVKCQTVGNPILGLNEVYMNMNCYNNRYHKYIHIRSTIEVPAQFVAW